MHEFLSDIEKIEDLTNKILISYNNFMKVSKGLRNRLLVRSAQIEFLINYWDKLIGKVQMRASAIND